ncbi:MAG: formate dehydrogenase accessory sulfurtransferase FdhD [Bacteroidia bacterium]
MNSVVGKSITRIYENGRSENKTDQLAVEEPLEISIQHRGKLKPVSVTMRTPGNDAELAIGFLFTENIVRNAENIAEVKHPDSNRIIIHLSDETEFSPESLDRNFYTTSSCGVCGKSSIDSVKQNIHAAGPRNFLSATNAVLLSLPAKLREAQEVFNSTGGIHASGLFNQNGELLAYREDVGRHNALDKLIGYALLEKINLHDKILLLSGRASFELLQKAAMAGIPLVAAIGAPSSLAVEMANENYITLIGFLKEDRFNVYTGISKAQS